MRRYDPYSGIHKSQRARLFDLGRRAGALGPDDVEAVRALAAEARALLADIREHAEHEDTFFRPWLETLDPSLAARFDAEHRELEPVLHGLENRAAAVENGPGEDGGAWNRFYSDFMRFTARYLLHIDGEEAAIVPALWARYTDAEIGAEIQRFLATLSPAQRAAQMGWMLPAMSHEERTQLLGMVRAGSPPEAFEGLRRLAATVLDPASFDRLQAALSGTSGVGDGSRAT
jgi:hemerythrin-like domain-containing protein